MKAFYILLGIVLCLLVIGSIALVLVSSSTSHHVISSSHPYFQTSASKHGEKYEVQQQVIGDHFDYVAYEQMVAEKQKERRNNEKYAIVTSQWKQERDFFSAEEARIEEFCKENGYFYCQDVTYTCDRDNECWKVVIRCDETDFEPSKLRYFHYDKRKDCRQWNAEVVRGSRFDYDELNQQDFSDASVQVRSRVRESTLQPVPEPVLNNSTGSHSDQILPPCSDLVPC